MVLSDEIQEKLSDSWKEKVKIRVIDGKLTVKNKAGDWKDDHFQRPDALLKAPPLNGSSLFPLRLRVPSAKII